MIVIDMDMPKSCQECLTNNGFAKCPFDCMEYVTERNPICPIKCDIEDIRAEIEHEGAMFPDGEFFVSIDRINEIFDKYIGAEMESSDADSN